MHGVCCNVNPRGNNFLFPGKVFKLFGCTLVLPRSAIKRHTTQKQKYVKPPFNQWPKSSLVREFVCVAFDLILET